MGLPTRIDPKQKSYSIYEGIDYHEYWQGYQKQKLDELEHAIVNRLLPSKGACILDLGCGYGRLAECYLNRYEQAVMLDGSISLLNQAQKQTNRRCIYVAADVNHLPFQSASFDTILCIRVLHHVENLERAVQTLHQITRANGRLVFTYYNKQNPLLVFKWLVRTTAANPFQATPSTIKENLLAHHPKHIRQTLGKAGYQLQAEMGAGVIDKVISRLGAWGRHAPAGLFMAPLLGRLHLAPWMFCSARVQSGQSGPIVPIEENFCCPACGHALERTGKEFICKDCSRSYPIREGIYDFRL